MTGRYGYGINQQRILRCLADGTPRTSAQVADATGMRRPRVVNAMRDLAQRKFVTETDERGYYQARIWAITPKGRAAVRDAIQREQMTDKASA